MKILYFQLLLALAISGSNLLQSQTINLHSISNERMPGGDTGYTLDGSQMVNSSTAKLLDASNFGPSGTYPKAINITHAYENSGDLESIASAGEIDLFFFGTFEKNNFSLVQFTSAEIDSLYNWSMRGGKLIIAEAANSASFPFDFQILDNKWDFVLEFNPAGNVVPSSLGSSTSIFDGPFGTVSAANQGGTIRGYFGQIPENSIILGEDQAISEPTLVLDCKTLDLIIADGDAFTSLGGITAGGTVSSQNDQFWTNVITYMDNLQGQPTLSMDGTTLSTGVYSSYQWLKDGNPIDGATSSSYNTNGEPGSYTVEVSLDCGCNNVSSIAFVIAGINEIGSNAGNLTIYPNPISQKSIVSFNLKESEQLKISVLDFNGREVITLFEGKLSAGEHQMNILSDTGQKLANGLYFLNLKGDKTSTNRRFIVQE